MQSGFKTRHRIAYRILFIVKLLATFRIFGDLVEYHRQVYFIKKNVVLENICDKKVNLGPKVSIIIPAKNEAETLPFLLKSINSQTYSNIETIVADCMS